MNSYTFSKIESLASVQDALLVAEILVVTMLFRVFSRSLNQEKTWYALNDRLCAKSPRKFIESYLFRLFPDDVLRVNFADLHDENGGPVLNQWFNKLNVQKSSKQVYVGSTFAVVAGNLGLRNPTESDFLRSEAFLSLKCAIDKHVLEATHIDQPTGDLSCVTADGIPTDEGSQGQEGEPPQESKELNLSSESNFLGSPPKCSTPRRESPPKIESPLDTSSCDNSAQSVRSGSSISSIVNGSFGPAYKKRKIQQKVEAAMGSIETVCSEQGETLGDVIAQSCLFQRKKTLNGLELICQVFSEVAKELGVRKAFNELIPKELWSQRVQMTSVPNWMLLLCKLESTITDDAWQMILNRTQLGKSGVSLSLNLLYIQL